MGPPRTAPAASLSGSNAKGILIFDDGGRYATVFERVGRPKFKSAS
jgi:hypothetical protein